MPPNETSTRFMNRTTSKSPVRARCSRLRAAITAAADGRFSQDRAVKSNWRNLRNGSRRWLPRRRNGKSAARPAELRRIPSSRSRAALTADFHEASRPPRHATLLLRPRDRRQARAQSGPISRPSPGTRSTPSIRRISTAPPTGKRRAKNIAPIKKLFAAYHLLPPIHPSAILRAPTDDDRRRMRDELFDDLQTAAKFVARKPARRGAGF